MSRFDHIEIRGFRRLRDFNLDLRSMCVLIGANGSGKTSLLEVFSLLAASASGRLKEEISAIGGFASNLTIGYPTQEMSFNLSMSLSGQNPLIYDLLIGATGTAYEIIAESLAQQRNPNPPPFKHIQSLHGDIRYFEFPTNKLVRPTWEHDPLETSLAQVPKMFPEPEELRNKLASSTHYHVLNVESRAPVRLPQPLRPATLPGRNGEDLVSCLFYLRETQRDRFEAVEDSLRAGFSSFERLDFPPVAAGTLAMTWKDRDFTRPFFMHQLSEGTLRFLWLVTLLQSPGLTAITMLDEPEVSLHPELLSLLADLMREASEHTQLIVATHSDRLVRFLDPTEVATIDLVEDGTARATWADQFDLDKWLQEFTLDEIWRRGRIGGRA